MEQQFINIKEIEINDLVNLINQYPWYGGARRELCIRMAKLSGSHWGKKHFAESALYIGSRKIIADIYKLNSVEDYSDNDIKELVQKYIDIDKFIPESNETAPKYERKVHIIGGDYFSKDDYEKISHTEDKPLKFSKFVGKTDTNETIEESEFYTETLAKIYIEQGHYEQAKSIYSKLILAFPEKNIYFANLIKEIDQLINK